MLSGPDLTESSTKLKGLKHFDAKFQLVPVGHHSRGSYYDPVPPLTMCSRCKKAANICISKDFILPLVEANPDLEEVRLAGVKVALPVMRYILYVTYNKVGRCLARYSPHAEANNTIPCNTI